MKIRANPIFPNTLPALSRELGVLWRELATSVNGIGSTAEVSNGNGNGYSRNLGDKLADIVSIKDFGAKGDGTTDDTSAIQDALDYAETLNCALFVPAGTYICSSAITYSGSNNFSFTIYGEGSYISQLVFTGATDGLVVTFADWRDGIFEIRNLGLFANYNGSTTALKVSCTTYTSSGTAKGPTIDNVYVAHRPFSDAATNHWTNGMYFKNIPHPCINNCWIQGSSDATPLGIGIQFDDQVITPIVTNSHIYLWSKGIFVDGTDTEGVHISDCQIIANYDGVYVDCSGTEPAFTIANSSLDNDHYNLYLKDRLRNIIAGCDFYRQANDTSGFVDIYLNAADNTSIYGNSFIRAGGGSNPATAIYTTGTIDTLNVFGNYARNRDTGLYLASTVARANVWGNDFDGLTTQIDDNTASGNKDITVVANKHAFNTSHTLVKMAASGQTLGTATLTTLNDWELVEDHGGGVFDTVGKAKITVPAGASKVVVRAQISFAADATGYRRVYVEMNGGNVSGMPWQTAQAVSGIATVINICSAPILVSAGDYFEVVASQSSGGDLDVQGGTNCWFSVEVLA